MLGMDLWEIRVTRQFTQVRLAEALDITQGMVSAMELRTDMRISTLRNYIAALGGKLKITAEFPDGAIQIDLSAREGKGNNGQR